MQQLASKNPLPFLFLDYSLIGNRNQACCYNSFIRTENLEMSLKFSTIIISFHTCKSVRQGKKFMWTKSNNIVVTQTNSTFKCCY